MATASRLTTYHLPVVTIYAGDLDITNGDLDMNSQGGVLNVGAAGNDWTGSAIAHESAVVGTNKALTITNTDNTNAASHAHLQLGTGGSSGGDPRIQFQVSGGEVVTIGLDNTASDNFTISDGTALGTADRLILETATGDLKLFGHLTVLITDTDGDTEGQLWYDASEDKLKFKTAAGVETVTSA